MVYLMAAIEDLCVIDVLLVCLYVCGSLSVLLLSLSFIRPLSVSFLSMILKLSIRAGSGPHAVARFDLELAAFLGCCCFSRIQKLCLS